MNFTDDLLVILSGYSKGYSLMRKRIRGYTGPALDNRFKDRSSETIRVTLYRLEKSGLIKRREDGIWSATNKGLNYITKKLKIREDKNLQRNKPKSIIISFDIPESHKTKRNWLRSNLKSQGFEMLHRSVWFGPAPLSRSFIRELLNKRLLKYMKFFEAKESEII